MSIAGKIRKAPNSGVLQQHKIKLERDYLEIEKFLKTDEFKEFEELDVIINSSDFLKNKKNIENLSYRKSEIFHDDRLYRKLSANRKLKIYFRVKDSGILDEYLNFSGSDLHIKLNGLKNHKAKNIKIEDKERMTRYFHDEKIKAYYKFEKSKDYRIYNEIENSQMLREYIELFGRVQSDMFIKERDFLKNKNRYTMTEDYQLVKKHNDYLNMSVVKKYLKYKNTDLFDFIKNWKLIFEDGFNDGKLDPEKWGYVANSAEEIIKSNFSLSDEKHFFTDGNNVSLKGNNLCIETKHEYVEGIMFDSVLGFKRESFKYSSGIVTSRGLFARKYGKFEAKIKFGDYAVDQCFWLAGDKPCPHIDVIKFKSSKRALCSLIPNIDITSFEKINKINLTSDFYIYSIEWLFDRITWKINDVIIWEQTENIPSEPLSLYFANAVYKNYKKGNAQMLIDWIKVYERVGE